MEEDASEVFVVDCAPASLSPTEEGTATISDEGAPNQAEECDPPESTGHQAAMETPVSLSILSALPFDQYLVSEVQFGRLVRQIFVATNKWDSGHGVAV